jgi:hypoxanthine phosphoribosyltransferase
MTKKLYLSDADVRTQVHQIMRDMRRDGWCPDYIVGITRGGAAPAVMLSHYMGVPMETLKVSLREGEVSTNCWMADDAFSGKKILVVDDINDTGATLAWIQQDWRASSYPGDETWNKMVWHKNVRFAVLVNNTASPAQVDYSGHEINKAEDDSWIVFPWENWWEK